jgi:hypothetical protein
MRQTSRISIPRTVLSLGLALGALTSCSGDEAVWAEPLAPDEATATGSLRLELTSTQGTVTYRLKRARFVVTNLSGARIQTIDGDSNADALTATTRPKA